MSKLTVGLTGGIGSGKSSISAQFEALGVPLLDADLIAREVVLPGTPGLADIAENFGADFIDSNGQLDRRKMREHVFANTGERRLLEAILHPRIHERMTQWRDAQQAPYCILCIATLLETSMRKLVNRVLVVDAAVETQLSRLTQRDGINQELAQSMIDAQATREVRLAAAHEVIHNDGDIEDAKREVNRLHALYLQIAADS